MIDSINITTWSCPVPTCKFATIYRGNWWKHMVRKHRQFDDRDLMMLIENMEFEYKHTLFLENKI